MSPKKSKKPKQPTTNNIEDSKKCFICDVCNASFIQKHHIVRHCRIHTGEKPYKCKVCCKSFRDQSNLQNHQNIHTEKKRFKCICCSKKFKKKDNLLVHYKTHSREKPYKCDPCNMSFTTNGNLTRHTKTKHHLKIQEQNVQEEVNSNNLENDHIVVSTEKRCHNQIKECFVSLSDYFKYEKIQNSNTSTSNDVKTSSNIDKDHSSM
ncbi:gastrula zinc finger protein XlCGF71.1-like [Melanaphis sacchari]|uniref:gastrula zinc finger protein XlCGF71.1-like n=1 Tax=Melanaphis sacchari TaxID=742174 RepID=UPI000DC14BC3|nr:gastrula zinc finger protein XlCGF71.1-like [Melanaphis sacchari]